MSNAADPRFIPPHNIEAERSVIGALLLDNTAFHKVVDVGLEPDDFYRENHAKLFESIRELVAKSEPVDIVTLSNALKNKGVLELVGGNEYITGLFEDSYSSAHAVHYSKIVKEKAMLRRLIGVANGIVEKVHDGVEDMEEFLDHAEKQIFDVTDTKLRNSFVDIKTVLMENMHTIQDLSEKKLSVTGVPTGFIDLDEKTSGLHPGQLIVIAARPAMGKTSFVLNLAENSALLAKKSVAIFSLEMSKEELGFRFLTSLAKVDASRLKVGRLQERDWKALAKAAGELSEAKIYLDDTPAISVLEMRSRCRRLQAEHGLDLIVVDYLQLMRGSNKFGKSGDRVQEISEISRSLKALAKELKVPVIALSQLNRGVESRPDKRPMMSDLRESGAIEQDADIVLFIYRDEVYNQDTARKGIAELIVGKHRAGSTGVVELAWQAEYTAFANIAREHYSAPAHKASMPQHMQDEPPMDDDPSMPSFRKGLDLPNF